MTIIASGYYGPKASELNKAFKNIEKKQAFYYFFVFFFSAEVFMLIFLIVMIPDSIKL